MDKEVGNGTICSESQASDKSKANSREEWKNRVGGKMRDLIDYRVIMNEIGGVQVFTLKKWKKNKGSEHFKFCL